MPLDSVDALSDDDALSQKAVQKKSPKKDVAPKAEAKSLKSGSEAKNKPKAKAKPKAVAKQKSLKRPAAAVTSGSATPRPKSGMKKPAGRKKDPDHISTCKSRYKNGVWSIKLFQKEVIRVTSMHILFKPWEGFTLMWNMCVCVIFTRSTGLQATKYDKSYHMKSKKELHSIREIISLQFFKFHCLEEPCSLAHHCRSSLTPRFLKRI